MVKRTILRHADRGPYDDDLARLIVAGVIAILAEPEADRETVEAAAAVVSEITAATGLVVAIQAVPAALAATTNLPGQIVVSGRKG